MITLICANCHHPFEKDRKEYNRVTKQGRNKFYCSEVCSGLGRVKPNVPLRFVLKNAKHSARTRKHEFDLSLEDIELIWKKQNGKCAYTGLSLILPTDEYVSSPRKASLDRIDSSKGYVKGNIEFVCVFVNLGKNGFSKQEIQDLLKEFKMGL